MMRRVLIPVLLVLFGLSAGPDAFAQGGHDRGFYIRGQLGYSGPSLNAANAGALIRGIEQVAPAKHLCPAILDIGDGR